MSNNFLQRFFIVQIALILFASLTFATNYYVDATNGNDNNSGLSPASAWRTINKINNFNFSNGDVISFKRGETFTGYTLQPPISNLTFNAYGTGAKPVIDGQGSRAAVKSNGQRDNLTFEFIKFYNGNSGQALFDVNGWTHVTIDSCIFDANHSSDTGMGAWTESNYLTIKRSLFENAGKEHGLYTGGDDNVLVEHCSFLNNVIAGWHMNQHNHSGVFSTMKNVIGRYNYFAGNGFDAIGDQACENSSFYYNVFDISGSDIGIALSWNNDNSVVPNHNTYYNNTFVSTNSSSIPIYFYNSSSIDYNVFENNIFMMPSNTATFVYQQSGAGTHNSFDYNIYYNGGSSAHWVMNGSTITGFSAWQTSGQDPNGNYTNPLMKDYQNGDYSLTSNSPAINAGTNVGLSADYIGDPIVGNPDLGAYEYQTKSTLGVKLNVKVFLSGPYSNGSMQTSLLSRGYIPKSQPYNTSPWNYNGSESVNSIPSGVVDWVLVELRSSTSASSTVATKAAFIKSDGSVVELDGSSALSFSTVAAGNYFIVIFHRNHLGVMSANQVSLSSTAVTYNFTTSESKAYGTNPMFSLGNGVYGMYPGDGNADGTVSNVDITKVWLPQFLNGKDGYQSADYNLDGSVTASDNNLYWLKDNGQSSQVNY